MSDDAVVEVRFTLPFKRRLKYTNVRFMSDRAIALLNLVQNRDRFLGNLIG